MDLNSALLQFGSDAGDAFERAHDDIDLYSTPQPNETPEQKQQREQRLNKARADLAAALAQLLQAATMTSDQKGRDGYADVVRLMKTTTDAAEAVCSRIGAIAAAPTQTSTDLDLLTRLGNVAAALAQLAPTRVWQKAPVSNS